MWNEAMNSKGINKLNCDSKGDLISYSDFRVTDQDSVVTCPCDTFNKSPRNCHNGGGGGR